ncbi:hypothetical protein ACS0TY_003050 [Phlomoides rotata]
MDSVFSVDDIADEFWLPHAPPARFHHDDDVDHPYSFAAAPSMAGMNRSSSEWAFQRFLEENTTQKSDDVIAINEKSANQQPEMVPIAAGGPPQNNPVNSEEHQAFLKSRLDLACAAVALTRATSGKAVESVAAADIGSQVTISSLNKAIGGDSLKTQVKESSGPVVPLPAISNKSVVQVRSTTSGSSGDQSEYDEDEGETEDTQNMDPSNTKRKRRMLSNRESARRSRRRKQAHLTDLETQVSQLKVENSSLHLRLTETSQKYNGAAVDNRVLKADIETLRTKVTLAEDIVKRMTGLYSLSRTGMPPVATRPSHTSAGVPGQNDPKQRYYHPPSVNLLTDHAIQNGVQPKTSAAIGGNETGRNVPMPNNVASSKHPIGEGTSSSTNRGT